DIGGESMEQNKKIKEDLYELYGCLKEMASVSGSEHFFAPYILEKLTYPLQEVQSALEERDVTQPQVQPQPMALSGMPTASGNEKKDGMKLSEKVRQIVDAAGVESFYKAELMPLFDKTLEDAVREQRLRKVTANDLKYLYSLMATVPLKGKKTKQEILQLIKKHFDNAARTEDMNAKFLGKR
ncbi:MAG: hypothetical protein RR817_10510, partial [Niameybacter sp.]